MHKAISYKPHTWLQPQDIKGSTSPSTTTTRTTSNIYVHLVSENSTIIFTKKGCCMGHVVKSLLLCHGVNPAIHQIEDGEEEVDILNEFMKNKKVNVNGENMEFPCVFVGGKFYGGLEKVINTHITGDLVPVLKQAGALWL
ncbi:hypothetical protein ACFE04_031095 [Oxalis oulophora]